eukprot:g4932.t1
MFGQQGFPGQQQQQQQQQMRMQMQMQPQQQMQMQMQPQMQQQFGGGGGFGAQQVPGGMPQQAYGMQQPQMGSGMMPPHRGGGMMMQPQMPGAPMQAQMQMQPGSGAAGGGGGGPQITRPQLVAFYQRRDPAKLGNVDQIMRQFNSAQIRANLMQKYGEAPGAEALGAGGGGGGTSAISAIPEPEPEPKEPEVKKKSVKDMMAAMLAEEDEVRAKKKAAADAKKKKRTSKVKLFPTKSAADLGPKSEEELREAEQGKLSALKDQCTWLSGNFVQLEGDFQSGTFAEAPDRAAKANAWLAQLGVFVAAVGEGVGSLQIGLLGEEMQPQKLQLNQACAQFQQRLQGVQRMFAGLAQPLQPLAVTDQMSTAMRKQCQDQWVLDKYKPSAAPKKAATVRLPGMGPKDTEQQQQQQGQQQQQQLGQQQGQQLGQQLGQQQGQQLGQQQQMPPAEVTRQQLVDFYMNRDPGKIGNVDNILAQFGHNPAQIHSILMQKYGETVGAAPTAAPAGPAAAAAAAAPSDLSDTSDPAVAAAYQKLGSFYQQLVSLRTQVEGAATIDQLAQQNGNLEKLQMQGIDSVQSAALPSPHKEEVKRQRKALNQQCEELRNRVTLRQAEMQSSAGPAAAAAAPAPAPVMPDAMGGLGTSVGMGMGMGMGVDGGAGVGGGGMSGLAGAMGGVQLQPPAPAPAPEPAPPVAPGPGGVAAAAAGGGAADLHCPPSGNPFDDFDMDGDDENSGDGAAGAAVGGMGLGAAATAAATAPPQQQPLA